MNNWSLLLASEVPPVCSHNTIGKIETHVKETSQMENRWAKLKTKCSLSLNIERNQHFSIVLVCRKLETQEFL